jgi:hypothetical protein
LVPFPVYPELHAHVKEAVTSEQAACTWQVCEEAVHSSALLQASPLPV